VAMAKNREERYPNTADMLEDLMAVRSGHPALHARRIVTLEDLDKIEETGKTVDIAPPVSGNPWLELMKQPPVIVLMAAQGVSVLVILILLVVMFSHK